MAKERDRRLRCPHCGGIDIRRSQPRGWWDMVMSAINRMPQRCRGCQHRFFVYTRREPAAAPDSGTTAGDAESR